VCERMEGVCERRVDGVVGAEDVLIEMDLECVELYRERGDGEEVL
jgi:hypothetical protein